MLNYQRIHHFPSHRPGHQQPPPAALRARAAEAAPGTAQSKPRSPAARRAAAAPGRGPGVARAWQLGK